MPIRVYRNLEDLPAVECSVLTIGSFDGVHLGHVHILNRLKALAAHSGCPGMVVSFDPHPRRVFGDTTLRLLNTLDEKASRLETLGIAHLVVVPFDRAFAEQSPRAYIEDFLVRRFKPRHIVIGYDHRYGKGRAGDVAYMRGFQALHGFEVEEIQAQELDGIAISSTKIRNALSQGQVRTAARLLGSEYALQGRVVEGLRIGTRLGFPTANLHVEDPDKLVPAAGIYAVRARLGQERFEGMLYIGSRPTLQQTLEPTIEVHLFDFDRQIYGQILRVEFVEFLRPDAKFGSLNELRLQLYEDRERALEILLKST